MGTIAEDGSGGFLGVEPKDFLDFGADESVATVDVNDKNKVWETVDQAAREFLLLIETLFHGAALGDVRKSTLITNNAAGSVANSGGGIQADDGLTVFPAKDDFPALRAGLATDLASDHGALLGVDKNFADLSAEEFFLGIVTEHMNEGRIDFKDLIVRSDDVDAFLKSFEELGETGFAAALRGDVSSEDGEPVNLVVANHGVGH